MVSQNKAIVRRSYEEVWSQGNLAAIAELYAPILCLLIRSCPASAVQKGINTM